MQDIPAHATSRRNLLTVWVPPFFQITLPEILGRRISISPVEH